MSHLYADMILKIDLTNQKITKESTATYSKRFIGGRGINSKIMFDEIGPKINPLDAENVIVFGVGPLTGTLCPGPSRVDVMTKSPVTGFLGDSNMGGHWAAELKYAGYDHLIIQGRAEKPVYISIDNDEVRIVDAASIWGKDTFMTPEIIRRELRDPEVKVLSIGRAGENRVTFASLLTNIGNAAGRNGMGAVLGSKNVKAIAVRGTKGVQVADPDRFFACCSKLHTMIRNAPGYEEYSKRGSLKSQYLGGTSGYAAAGNQQIFDWDRKADLLAWWEKFGVKRAGCFGCPVQCKETYTFPGTGSGIVSCIHYAEPTWKMKNDDVLLWWEFVRNCQMDGVDVISISGILAWVMELYENGIISEKDTDGIAMRWGDREAIITMMKKIINREGVGDVLADGFKVAIQQFGEKSADYAMHVKNSPTYAGSPRFPFIGLEAALGPRGDYMRAFVPFARGVIRVQGDPEMSPEEKEKAIKAYEDQAEKITGIRKAASIMGYEGWPKAILYAETMISIPDMLGICKYMGIGNFQVFDAENQAELFSIGLGRNVSSDEMVTAAIRNRNVERAFEVREGLTRKDDTIPKREFNKEIGGRYEGVYVDPDKFEKAKDEYYALRGWDIHTGIPTQETLVALGLEDVVKDLRSHKLISE